MIWTLCCLLLEEEAQRLHPKPARKLLPLLPPGMISMLYSLLSEGLENRQPQPLLHLSLVLRRLQTISILFLLLSVLLLLQLQRQLLLLFLPFLPPVRLHTLLSQRNAQEEMIWTLCCLLLEEEA